MNELNMEFSENVEQWLASALAVEVPQTVVAYSFNLFELASGEAKYGIELIGADEFDDDDMDWACAEAWVASPRAIPIPREFADGSWETCLRDTKQMLVNLLRKSSGAAAKLKEGKAVAVGFVDGDLDIVWQG